MAPQEYDGPGTIDQSGEGRLELRNGPGALKDLHQFFDGFTRSIALPTEISQAADLALTEWVTNVLSYGFSEGQAGVITIRVHWRQPELRMEVDDSARPFNPLEHPAVDITRPLDQKPMGGLGIHLLRSVMDELRYTRTTDGNRLIMVKRLPEAGSRSQR